MSNLKLLEAIASELARGLVENGFSVLETDQRDLKTLRHYSGETLHIGSWIAGKPQNGEAFQDAEIMIGDCLTGPVEIEDWYYAPDSSQEGVITLMHLRYWDYEIDELEYDEENVVYIY